VLNELVLCFFSMQGAWPFFVKWRRCMRTCPVCGWWWSAQWRSSFPLTTCRRSSICAVSSHLKLTSLSPTSHKLHWASTSTQIRSFTNPDTSITVGKQRLLISGGSKNLDDGDNVSAPSSLWQMHAIIAFYTEMGDFVKEMLRPLSSSCGCFVPRAIDTSNLVLGTPSSPIFSFIFVNSRHNAIGLAGF